MIETGRAFVAISRRLIVEDERAREIPGQTKRWIETTMRRTRRRRE
jgi:hypothetical protein